MPDQPSDERMRRDIEHLFARIGVVRQSIDRDPPDCQASLDPEDVAEVVNDLLAALDARDAEIRRLREACKEVVRIDDTMPDGDWERIIEMMVTPCRNALGTPGGEGK